MVDVKTRNPQFSVRFVTERLGEFTISDTHDSIISIACERTLGNTAGSFALTLVPRLIIGGPSGQWWDAITANDFVEIRVWVPPTTPEFPLFRGFVDSVAYSANYGARGQRLVQIVGRDYGKLLLQTKLYYPMSEEVQEVTLFQQWQRAFTDTFGDLSLAPPERPPMTLQQTSSGPDFTPSAMQRALFDGFYKPQEREFLDTFELANKPPGLQIRLDTEKDLWNQDLRTYNPTFFGKGLAPFSALWDLMYAYQHRPWYEFVMMETPSAPALVHRPAPWLSRAGNWVQGNPDGLKTWEVTNAEIVSVTLVRSDAQNLNYFLVVPEQYAYLAGIAKTTGNLEGSLKTPLRDNPFLVGLGDVIPTDPSAMSLTSRYQRFGFRLAEVSTPYLSMERGLAEEQVVLQIAKIREQASVANLRLRSAFDHNHLLESGPLTLRGNNTIQAGDYVRLSDRGGARYYVESVRHDLKIPTDAGTGHFLTHVQVSRGRGHLSQHYGLPP